MEQPTTAFLHPDGGGRTTFRCTNVRNAAREHRSTSSARASHQEVCQDRCKSALRSQGFVLIRVNILTSKGCLCVASDNLSCCSQTVHNIRQLLVAVLLYDA